MNRTLFSSRISPLFVFVGLVLVCSISWAGIQLVKYNYPDSLASAKDVPGWMVEARYGTFTSADMLALRNGQCNHDPVFVRPKSDGTAILTCGIPAQPTKPVLLFVADALDLKSDYAAWEIEVTASYVSGRGQFVSDVDALHFIVPVGECVKGASRTVQMLHGPVTSAQEICVKESERGTRISGWVFAKPLVTDVAFKGERGASDRGSLQYGEPVDVLVVGDLIEVKMGHYRLKAFRNNSL